VNALLAGMSAEASAVVAKGSFGAETAEMRIAYMRYVGQGHEIAVPLPVRALEAGDVASLRAPMTRSTRASMTGRCRVRTWRC
jgi:N-methylhydantoinase A